MPAPQPWRTELSVGHTNWVIFRGLGTIKDSLMQYGTFFDGEVNDDELHCMAIDPRFRLYDVMAYIVELGGTVFVPPPPPEE